MSLDGAESGALWQSQDGEKVIQNSVALHQIHPKSMFVVVDYMDEMLKYLA